MIDTATYPIIRMARLTPRANSTWGLRVAALGILVLRFYIGFVWLRFGVTKLASGWLTSNPLEPLLSMVAAHQLPTTAPGYSWIANALLTLHADEVLSVLIPCTEVLIAMAMFSGRYVRFMALVACALNANLLLAGIASVALDGRMIVLQLVLIALLTLARK